MLLNDVINGQADCPIHYQSLFYALINEAGFWQEVGFLMLNLSASSVTRFIPLRYDVIRIDQNT